MADIYCGLKMEGKSPVWAADSNVCGYSLLAGSSYEGNVSIVRPTTAVDMPASQAIGYFRGTQLLSVIDSSFINSVPKTSEPYTEVPTGITKSSLEYFQIIDASCGYQPEPDCNDNSDCPDGEKCVDGECVPCDTVTDLSGSASLMGLDNLNRFVSDKTSHTFANSTPISKAVGDFSHISRLRITNSDGFPAGSIAVVANYQNLLLLTNLSESLGVIHFTEGQSDAYLEINKPKVSTYGWSLLSLTLTPLFGDAGKCNDEVITPPEDAEVLDGFVPPVKPVLPPPPVGPVPPEPEKPDEYEPPIPPTPPMPPTPPTPPASGCECEIYIAQEISTSITVLAQSVALLKDTMSPLVSGGLALLSTIISKLFDWFFDKTAWLGEWLQKFLDFGYYFGNYLKEFYEAQQVLNREKTDELIDELKTFNEKFSEYVDKYEPVQIENEYRTQSHRIIDNLDSTITKL